MKITDVRVRLVNKDCFVVHDVKIIDGNDGFFIAMPSRKTADGEFKDVAHPIKSETRNEIIESVLEAYKNEVAKAVVAEQK